MRSFVLLLSLIATCTHAAVGDFIFLEQTTSLGRTVERRLPKGPNIIMGTDASSLPIPITLGSGLDLNLTTKVLSATASGGTWGTITGTLSAQTDLVNALALKAPLASPTFTGTVTIPAGASISGYLTTASAASTYLTTASAASTYLTTASAASTYQPLDTDLTAIAALTTTSHGRGLLDDADAAASRVSLGLVIGTHVQAWDADLDDLADGSLTGSKIGAGINAANITTSTLAVANGGTGQSTVAAARLALLPSVSGNAGKVLTVNGGGTDVQWSTPSAGGSTISTPRIIYVAKNGSDSTGEVGNPAKPFLTGTVAWTTGQAAAQDFVLHFGWGFYTLYTSGQATGYLQGIVGAGPTMTTVEVETSNAYGPAGEVTLSLHHVYARILTTGISAGSGSGENGQHAGNVSLTGIADIVINADGGAGDGSGSGGNGSYINLSGPLRLRGGLAISSVSGAGGESGSAGGSGALDADGCDLRGSVYCANIGLARCSYTTGLTITNDRGGNAAY